MPLKSIMLTIWKTLTSNLVAKLMALAMAVALWLYAYNFSFTSNTIIQVPVQIPSSEGWTLTGNVERTVEVVVVYPRRFQNQVNQALATGQIRVTLNAGPDDAGADEQPVSVTLQPTDLVTPAGQNLGIRVVGFRTETLQLYFIREMTKALRVAVRVTEPPLGYQTPHPPYPLPATVNVRGRKDKIARATTIETELIDISGTPPGNVPEWPVVVTARLMPYIVIDGEQFPVAPARNEVQVRILLTQVMATRLFQGVPIRVLQPTDYPYTVTLRERTTDVRVRGPESVVNMVTPENIVLFVNAGNLQPSDLYYTERIEADIVRTPRSGELSVTLGTSDAAVKVSEPPARYR